MREGLKEICGVRARFRGTFTRFGSAVVWFRVNGRKHGRDVRTLVLVDVTDTKDRPLTDHLWFQCGKRFDELELKPGDRVEFSATVDRYLKRRFHDVDDSRMREVDYCLKRPANMVKLGVHDDKGGGLLFADVFHARAEDRR